MYLYVDCSFLANSAANGMAPEQLRFGPPAIALDIVAKIAQFVRSYEATRVYFCLDPVEGSWRKQVTPTYKAQRATKLEQDPVRKAAHEMATTTINEVLPEVIELMGCVPFVYPWLEADDMAAAAIANHYEKPGIVITADKDYWQLLTPNISMVDPAHSLKYTVENGYIARHRGNGVVESLGMTPAETLLAKAIQGDISDNLPGLIGIGEVTATKAVQEKTVAKLLTEETGLVTPRKSKNNPAPVPVQQDARKVVADNLAMMDLLHSRVHAKARTIVQGIEQKSMRPQVANFSRFALWLEQKHQFSREQAEATARQLCTTYRNVWTS